MLYRGLERPLPVAGTLGYTLGCGERFPRAGTLGSTLGYTLGCGERFPRAGTLGSTLGCSEGWNARYRVLEPRVRLRVHKVGLSG